GDLIRETLLYSFHGNIHIGLSRREPDIAEVNILTLNLVGTSEGHGERTTGWLGRELCLPATFLHRYRYRWRLAQTHFDDGFRGCPTPDLDRLVPLQHHTVTKNSGQGYLCLSVRGEPYWQAQCNYK